MDSCCKFNHLSGKFQIARYTACEFFEKAGNKETAETSQGQGNSSKRLEDVEALV
jgi:hypothetical protein